MTNYVPVRVDLWQQVTREVMQQKEALDLLRPAHHTPYADEEHQGGNCVDWVMALLARAHKAENAARSAMSLLETLTEAHASVVMDSAEDTAAQDQLVTSARRGVAALKSILDGPLPADANPHT